MQLVGASIGRHTQIQSWVQWADGLAAALVELAIVDLNRCELAV